MTRISLYQDERGIADNFCHSRSSGCTFQFPNQATVTSSVLRNPMSHPPRRRSLRLKEISAIYESKDTAFCSELQQKTSEAHSPVARQVEILLVEQPKSANKSTDYPHDLNGIRHNDNFGNKEGNCDEDEQNFEYMTLKDLQSRFRAKRRKVRRSIVAEEFDMDTKTDVKLKLEEEFDLEEPLIRLKLNLSKQLSSVERKRKKLTCCSENVAQGSGRVSAKCRLLLENIAELNEPKSSTCDVSQASAAENCGLPPKKTDTEIGDLPIYSETMLKRDNLYTSSDGSVYNVKKEIMETCALDEVQNMVTTVNHSTSGFIEPFQDGRRELDNRVSSCLTGKVLQLHADGLMEVTTGNTSYPVPELERSIKNSLKLVPNSNPEVPEPYSTICESTVYFSDCPDVDFIAKYNCAERSSYKIPERAEPGTGEWTTINSLPSGHMGLEKLTNLAEHDHRNLEKFRKMDASEMSPYQVLSLLVSECETVPSEACSQAPISGAKHLDSNLCSTAENSSFLLVEDTHYESMEGMNATEHHMASKEMVDELATQQDPMNATEHHMVSKEMVDELATQQDPMISHSSDNKMCYSLLANAREFNMVSKDPMNIVEVPAQQIPELGHLDDDKIDHSLVNREVIGSCDGPDSSAKVQNSDCIVYKAQVNGETNSNKSTAITSLKGGSSTGTHNLSCIQHSLERTNTPIDSQCIDVSLAKSEASFVEKMLDYTDGEAGSSELIARAVEAHSAQNSSCSFCPVNGFYHADDSSSEAIEKKSSSLACENQDLSADRQIYLSTGISQSDDIEECNLEDADKHLPVRVENPPRKIFSNRKTLSPASQEKLVQVLSGNDLYDALKHSGYREIKPPLGPDQMIKKPKQKRNLSLPPMTKGILKFQDSSSKTHCSSSKSMLTHVQTEEAIKFSQRQLHDVKNIAAKLLNGMNTMKNIIEENVCSEACQTTKFTAEEIKEAIQHAADLEATTNKWLSIMSRDCSRFCKIMRSTENKAASPIKGVHKEGKKISFADEAGGMLCHVKVFDQQPASFAAPENDS